MSSIEFYKQKQMVADRLKKARDLSFGLDDTRNDKAQFSIGYDGLEGEWQEMKFTIHASHGYYGSSSAYSDTSKELGEYLAEAFNEPDVLRKICDRAVELAQISANKAKAFAKEEAEKVLQETKA